VAYSFVAPTTGRFVVSLTPKAGFEARAAVIEDACDPSGRCLGQTLDMSADQVYRLPFDAVSGRTYFVVVDSASPGGGNQTAGTNIGPFAISISQ
ncbi:MAG TPA: hypothetical protein VGD87_09400, partial [Archangium sp.]